MTDTTSPKKKPATTVTIAGPTAEALRKAADDRGMYIGVLATRLLDYALSRLDTSARLFRTDEQP